MSTPDTSAADDKRRSRDAALGAFLSVHGLDHWRLEPLVVDASTRCYFRIISPDGQNRHVVMDAPVATEKPQRFQEMSIFLNTLGFSAPAVLAADLDQGFLLLEDFGDTTFGTLLKQGSDPDALYREAVDTLITLQQRWRVDDHHNPPLEPYDMEFLLFEVGIFLEWYWTSVMKEAPSDSLVQDFKDLWRQVLEPVVAGPKMMVLRDYIPDNIMRVQDREGLLSCGLIDFQDALIGVPSYDLASLLRDARRDQPNDLSHNLLQYYLDQRPELDRDATESAFWVLAAQRNIKILGIFTRLSKRDGKHHYLPHIPRIWRLLAEELSRSELAPIAYWMDQNLPKVSRRIPFTPTLVST